MEAELGRLQGVEEGVNVDEGSAFLTDPKEAVEFVGETGCVESAASRSSAVIATRPSIQAALRASSGDFLYYIFDDFWRGRQRQAQVR